MSASSPRALLLALLGPSLLVGCLDWSSRDRATPAQDEPRPDAEAMGPEPTLLLDEADANANAPDGDAEVTSDDRDAQLTDEEDTGADATTPDADAGADPDGGEPASSTEPCPGAACGSAYACVGNAATYTCRGQYADFPLPVRRSADDLGAQGLRAERLVVHDDVTGLMWPREALDASLSFADAVAACSELSLGGFDDWRMPSLHEFVTLLGSERALDVSTTAFLNFRGDDYWTGSLDSEQLDVAFIARTYGGLWITKRDFSTNTRFQCVRTERVTYSGPPGGRFVSEADGALLHDIRTGLHWEARVSVTRTRQAYADADAYCRGLGIGGRAFRLPSIAEMTSMVDFARPSGMRLPSGFSGGLGDIFYWTRSLGPVEADPPFTACMHTGGGTDGCSLVDGRAAVRCVSTD